jgi:N-acyl-L-homoserine lactone synthetase
MIFLVNAENRGQFAADLGDMHRQRKIVFVDRAGWTVPVVGDSEADCYDREDTIYLLAKGQPDGQVLASARLLPTTGPHLMSELFAGVCRETPPRGPTVWEVSRFCTTPELSGRGMRLGLLWEVICGVMEAALLYGMDQVLFAANRALLPLALECGWDARTLGPALRDGEDETTAVVAAITQAGLRAVRRRHGVPAPVTRLLANAPPSGPSPFACRPPVEPAQGVAYPGGWIGHLCYDWPSG